MYKLSNKFIFFILQWNGIIATKSLKHKDSPKIILVITKISISQYESYFHS
jgi:hypothetical protein